MVESISSVTDFYCVLQFLILMEIVQAAAAMGMAFCFLYAWGNHGNFSELFCFLIVRSGRPVTKYMNMGSFDGVRDDLIMLCIYLAMVICNRRFRCCTSTT